MITEDLVEMFLQALEGGTATNEGEGELLTMVDREKYGNNGNS